MMKINGIEAALFDKRLNQFMSNDKNKLSFDQISLESEDSYIKKICNSCIGPAESDRSREDRISMKRSDINIIANEFELEDDDTDAEEESALSVSSSSSSFYESTSDHDRTVSNIGSINIVMCRSKNKHKNKSRKNDTPNNSDDDTDADDEQIIARDRYIKHMDSIVESIKKMNWGDTITVTAELFDSSYPLLQKMCAITKIVRYSSFVFNGSGSKTILRYFMNKTKNDPIHRYQKIVQILSNNGFRRFIPIRSWTEFWGNYRDEPVKTRYLFELIRSDQPCKPYLDIEWISDDVKDARTQDYSDFVIKLQKDLISIFKRRYKIIIDESSIMISTAHSSSKTSFHVVIDKQIGKKTLAFRTNRKGYPESAWDMFLALIELDSFYKDVLDGAVYTTDREFRVLYSNKTTEFRPFVPYSKSNKKSKTKSKSKQDVKITLTDQECMRYIVTYAPYNEYHHIVTPAVPKQYVNLNREEYDDFNIFIPPTYSDKKINHLMSLARIVHPTSEYTGRSPNGGWRFSYKDKSEECYTGNYHESNGFYIFENTDKGTIYMKCMSDDCKGIRILEGKENVTPKLITKKLF